MASISLTIPNPIANRVLDSFCAKKGYTGFLPDSITPITKQDFLKADLIKYIKNNVAEHEAIIASNAACQTAQQYVEDNITIS